MDQYFRMFMFLFLCIFINYIQSKYLYNWVSTSLSSITGFFNLIFKGNELYLKEFVSNKTMNWTEAVQYCKAMNSILVSSPTQTDHEWNHWTRKQWRMSPWIHVIGLDLIWVTRTKQEIYIHNYIDYSFNKFVSTWVNL